MLPRAPSQDGVVRPLGVGHRDRVLPDPNAPPEGEEREDLALASIQDQLSRCVLNEQSECSLHRLTTGTRPGTHEALAYAKRAGRLVHKIGKAQPEGSS